MKKKIPFLKREISLNSLDVILDSSWVWNLRPAHLYSLLWPSPEAETAYLLRQLLTFQLVYFTLH